MLVVRDEVSGEGASGRGVDGSGSLISHVASQVHVSSEVVGLCEKNVYAVLCGGGSS
jgi:hypothetical protein